MIKISVRYTVSKPIGINIRSLDQLLLIMTQLSS